jgi:beta-lactamase class A
MDLKRTIADSYRVKNISELPDGLAIALITDTRPNESLRFYITNGTALPAASTVKVVVLARLMSELETRNTKGKWGLDGVDWGPLAKSMISVSDNEAANKILERYGSHEMNRWLSSLGYHSGEITFNREFQGVASKDGENLVTASALAKFYFLVAQEDDVPGFLNAGSLKKLRTLIDSDGTTNNQPQFNDRLNARFHKDVRFLHKTGSNSKVLADGGIVVDGNRSYILVVVDASKNKEGMQRLGLGVLQLMRKYVP